MWPKDSPRNLGSKRWTIPKEEIPLFLAELRRVQEDMIEELVRRSERAGFPEAQTLLNKFTLKGTR